MSATTAVLSAREDRVAPRSAFAAGLPEPSAGSWEPDDRTLDRLRVLNLVWDEHEVRSAADASDAADLSIA